MKKVTIYSVLAGVEVEQEFNELQTKGTALVSNKKMPLFLEYCQFMGVDVAGGAIEGNGRYLYKL